jgi:hypothetical protein
LFLLFIQTKKAQISRQGTLIQAWVECNPQHPYPGYLPFLCDSVAKEKAQAADINLGVQ